ncbi:MAG: cell division protein ZapA [Eubacteriales bacterium]|jgi:cell division protein ZapA|nr:cell division protein ZapA [Eubacteriales bacterium]
METNKVTVKIYGQEYVISGEKSSEEIKKIADYVDGKMKLIGRVITDGAAGKIAILSSINIAEEYFDSLDQIETLKKGKEQLENDSKYYLKMWEEAKKNFIQYKENVLEMKNQKKESDERFKELQEQCSEYENSFFELQMENIKLKSEIDKLKREQG